MDIRRSNTSRQIRFDGDSICTVERVQKAIHRVLKYSVIRTWKRKKKKVNLIQNRES
jgi:hypothetical protein